LDESGGLEAETLSFQRIRESFHTVRRPVCIQLEGLSILRLTLSAQAFSDSLVDDLQLARPCYSRVMRILAEIRDSIMALTLSS
jgi:hypothetical protein